MKHILFLSLLLLIFSAACSPDGPENLFACVPCGDFMITCEMCDFGNYGCPVCFSAAPEMTWEYANGAYAIMEGTGMAYYDPLGNKCYSMVTEGTLTTVYGVDDEVCYAVQPGEASGDMIWFVNDKTYVAHEDGSWTCPNGSTWQMPEGCIDNATSTPAQPCTTLQDLPPCP